jgi:hypothetical protein
VQLHPADAEAARNALAKIFWGTLICVFDFHISQTSNGTGFKFDLISDVVGTILVAWGLGQLQPLLNEARYLQIMRFCRVMAILSVLDALLDHVVTPWPAPLRALFIVFGFVCLVAIYQFCAALRTFCIAGGLLEAERSWSLSQRLFLILNLIPAALLQLASLIFMMRGSTRARLDVGPLAIVLVSAAIVPLVHLLLSISRTRRALEDRARLTKFM